MKDFDICLHHRDCNDGFTSAWVFSEYDRTLDVEYKSVTYNEAPPDVKGKRVLIVDFSYKAPVLERMAKEAKYIVVLDHHEGAERELASLIDKHENLKIIFDMDMSGAALTWQYFFPYHDVPNIVKYVQDRDLWKHKMDRSKHVNAYLDSVPYDFDAWSAAASNLSQYSTLLACADAGAAILGFWDRAIRDAVRQTLRLMTIGGYHVFVANLPHRMASNGAEIVEEFAKSHPFYNAASKNDDGELLFTASYFDTPTGRKFSLRSRSGFDTINVSKLYGGSGHRPASGFNTLRGWEGETLIPGQPIKKDTHVD